MKMSIQQNMHFQLGLLKVDASGEFLLEGAKQAFLEMLGAVVQYKAEKILYDLRKVKGFPTNLERFIYGEFVACETQKIVKKHRIAPRFAYVIHEPLHDLGRLAETVAVNRGMDVKTFEAPEDAFEWLTKAR